MAIQYQYDAETNLLHVHPGECLTFSFLRDYFNAILLDEAIQPDFIEVVHFDEIHDFNIASNEAIPLTKLFQRLVAEKHYRGTFILAKTELQFGMARMLKIIGSDVSFITIVRTVDELDAGIHQIRHQA